MRTYSEAGLAEPALVAEDQAHVAVEAVKDKPLVQRESEILQSRKREYGLYMHELAILAITARQRILFSSPPLSLPHSFSSYQPSQARGLTLQKEAWNYARPHTLSMILVSHLASTPESLQ